MKLFVTGASGFIGSRFCTLAIGAGYEVTGLTRPSSASFVPPEVHRLYGSLPYDIRESAVEACDAVIHLAAITTSKRAAESKAVNEYGTEYLVRLAELSQGKRFIFTSTQSVHSENDSAYAATKRRSEEVVRTSALSWAILRPGLVYGPGQHGLFARMRKSVAGLPVMPLLGGGKAIVQPIHVDDLCSAILTILSDFSAFASGEFDLGDPTGITLKELLKRISAASGKDQRQVSIPLAPVKFLVKAGEKMRLSLPIGMDNLKGLETVQPMNTAPSLGRLRLELRDLDEGLQQSAEPTKTLTDDRISTLLIGAGKIGIVHGLQIMYNPDARFAGIVEPGRKAAQLYSSMGFKAPFYSSIDEAMESNPQPSAAVIATPADTHFSVAKTCLEAGLSVLVEKPLSISSELASQWRELKEQHQQQLLHTGYMGAQFPHLLTAYHFARMNKLGHIFKARAVALQTHITAREPVRWEMMKKRAGGGVMINFGCHVASMMFRLLGWPDSEIRGWQWPIYSSEVEDAIVAQFSVKSTQCTIVASWSVSGFARPYNLVELECEHGTIKVENSCIYLVQQGAATLLKTQLDYDIGFNMAPDYTGGGFTLEHDAFIKCVKALREKTFYGTCKTDYMPPVEMPEAIRLESWIRNVYETLPVEKPIPPDLSGWEIPADIIDRLLSAGER